ncbi:MAG: radical SAM protein [Desulfobacterales bacterium]
MMHYEGPIYRPPSEADSLLVQATVGCPHNRCTFCMVYKNGPRYKVRPVADICEDLLQAAQIHGSTVSTLFFPAGNTIAMKTSDLCEICQYAYQVFPKLNRITVYGSFQYIHQKGLEQLKRLAAAGLARIHVGLESGDDAVLRRLRKGTHSGQQIEAGKWVMKAGIELSLYVMLGIGGKDRTVSHAIETARVLNAVAPNFIRLRTFLPKIDTPLLADVTSGRFQMLGPHAILRETRQIIAALSVTSRLTSDHYTNHINLEGGLPEDKPLLLAQIESALKRDESTFRSFYVGTQ